VIDFLRVVKTAPPLPLLLLRRARRFGPLAVARVHPDDDPNFGRASVPSCCVLPPRHLQAESYDASVMPRMLLCVAGHFTRESTITETKSLVEDVIIERDGCSPTCQHMVGAGDTQESSRPRAAARAKGEDASAVLACTSYVGVAHPPRWAGGRWLSIGLSIGVASAPQADLLLLAGPIDTPLYLPADEERVISRGAADERPEARTTEGYYYSQNAETTNCRPGGRSPPNCTPRIAVSSSERVSSLKWLFKKERAPGQRWR